MSLKIVFMGTPEFAVASLDKLFKEGCNIPAVITMPDKPVGRGQNIQYSPVKQYALDNNLPILQPEKLKDPEFLLKLKNINAELFVVVAFRMLPEEVWSLPPLGTINLHSSLLPQYRGAAPINWVIINGETETGVSTFFIEKDIDTGNILFSEKTSISDTETAGELHDRLMNIGAGLLLKTVKAIETGNIKPIQQNNFHKSNERLKPAPKIFKNDCQINWNRKSIDIYNFIRGLSPYPAGWSVLRNKSNDRSFNVKIFKTGYSVEQQAKQPGTIITDTKTYLNVATTDGIIDIKILQLEGKKKLSVEEFLRGFHGIEEFTFII